MTQQPRYGHPSAARGRVARLLLVALALAACDSGRVTGPREPAEGPPQDTKRLKSVVMIDAELDATTRNDYLYDGAGRLRRVEFRRNQVDGGPPVWLTMYSDHTYTGDVLTQTDWSVITADGSFAHWKRLTYSYDARGYLTRETWQEADGTGVQDFVVENRYDARGRLAEVREQNGDRILYTYAADGSLTSSDYRYPDGSRVRFAYQNDSGRNPFFRRPAHVYGTLLPLMHPSLLLSPTNPVRIETRAGSDPTVVSSVTNEYTYDAEGRPLHIRQRFINDVIEGSRGTVLLMDLEYEPAL